MGNALTLGKGTLVSRILGFARDASIAALVGGGWAADALVLSLRLPNIARTLLTEGALAYSLVPVFRSLLDENTARAWAFVRSMTLALFAVFGFFVIIGVVFPDRIAAVLAPGFLAVPNVLAMASGFMLLCLTSLPLISGAAVISAALIAAGNFWPPAYGAAVFNLVIVLFAGAAFLVFGTGSVAAPYVICIGVIVSGAVLWGYQACFLHRLGFSPAGPVAFSDPVFVRAFRALPRSVFSVSGHHVNVFLAVFLASFLAEGAISSLYFAERLVNFPLGVVGVSMGLATLADLSKIAASFTDADTEENSAAHSAAGPDAFTHDAAAAGKALFAERLAQSGRVTLYFALPATVGTACLAAPLASVIFGYGEFGNAALARTTAALLAYLTGLPALALARPMLAGLGALGDGKAPMRAALAGLAATAVFGTLSLLSGEAWGPALAVSIAAWVNAAALARMLVKRGFSPLPSPVWLLKVLAACAVMAVCVIWGEGFFSSAIGKIAAVPLGVAVYFAAAPLLRLEEGSGILRAAAARARGKE